MEFDLDKDVQYRSLTYMATYTVNNLPTVIASYCIIVYLTNYYLIKIASQFGGVKILFGVDY